MFEAAAGRASAWVALTRHALLEFWTDGTTWLDDEVTAFKQALTRLV